MHIFEYRKTASDLLNPEIFQLIMEIHECKGKQSELIKTRKDDLVSLLNVARIQSTSSSNKIEGIFTSDKRLRELMEKKSEPRNRSEQEIAGYREVLKTIHENYEFMSLTPNLILQLHRDLYSYSSGGGAFKNADNFISETDAKGNQVTRFIPVPAFQTKEFVDDMCSAFSKAMTSSKLNPLMLIPMFILDFLCIHPFNDGNGRISRLLTLLLFYQSGYTVGKYVSIEMLIEQSKETYYESLQKSSQGWHDNKCSYEPFLKYYLGILLKAYREFDNRMAHTSEAKTSKPERIKKLIIASNEPISKKQIMDYYPDISKVTVERALIQLTKEEIIRKIGSTRLARYMKN